MEGRSMSVILEAMIGVFLLFIAFAVGVWTGLRQGKVAIRRRVSYWMRNYACYVCREQYEDSGFDDDLDDDEFDDEDDDPDDKPPTTRLNQRRPEAK